MIRMFKGSCYVPFIKGYCKREQKGTSMRVVLLGCRDVEKEYVV